MFSPRWLSFSNWARYPRWVDLRSTRSPEECAASLSLLTRRRSNRKVAGRPLVGQVHELAGRVRFSLSSFAYPSRVLAFELIPQADGGTVLRGELAVMLPIRCFSGIYFALAVLCAPYFLVSSLRQHNELGFSLFQGFITLFMGTVFMFGYNGLCVWISRHIDFVTVSLVREAISKEGADSTIANLFRYEWGEGAS